MVKKTMKAMRLPEINIDGIRLDKWKAILREAFLENCEKQFVEPYGEPEFKVAEIDRRHPEYTKLGECTIIALFHKVQTFDVPMEIVEV